MGPEQGRVRLGSVTLAMGREAGIPQRLGQPTALGCSLAAAAERGHPGAARVPSQSRPRLDCRRWGSIEGRRSDKHSGWLRELQVRWGLHSGQDLLAYRPWGWPAVTRASGVTKSHRFSALPSNQAAQRSPPHRWVRPSTVRPLGGKRPNPFVGLWERGLAGSGREVGGWVEESYSTTE